MTLPTEPDQKAAVERLKVDVPDIRMRGGAYRNRLSRDLAALISSWEERSKEVEDLKAKHAADMREAIKTVGEEARGRGLAEARIAELEAGISKAIRQLSDADEHEWTRVVDARDTLIITRDAPLLDILTNNTKAGQP